MKIRWQNRLTKLGQKRWTNMVVYKNRKAAAIIESIMREESDWQSNSLDLEIFDWWGEERLIDEKGRVLVCVRA